MIADMVPTVREALGVSSAFDASIIPNGIRRTIRFLLRTYYFPQALRVSETLAMGLGTAGVTLPTDLGGRAPSRVRLRLVPATGDILYKTLRRGALGMLPSRTGPDNYIIEGLDLKLDRPMPEAGYDLQVWYYSTDVDLAEPWITADFEDVVYLKSVMDLALTDARKPDVYQAFNAAWTERQVGLAIYLNEAEFADTDISMDPRGASFLERYPS
jgi:hypothetical protein